MTNQSPFRRRAWRAQAFAGMINARLIHHICKVDYIPNRGLMSVRLLEHDPYTGRHKKVFHERVSRKSFPTDELIASIMLVAK